MNKVFFIITILLIGANSFAQPVTPESPMTKEDYIAKSKKQRKTAKTLLITGTSLIALSLVFPKGDLDEDGSFWFYRSYSNDGIRGALLLAGVALDIISFPVCHASKKNLKKAAALGFKMEKIGQGYRPAWVNNSFPALKFTIKI